jgi:hypothetical protein
VLGDVMSNVTTVTDWSQYIPRKPVYRLNHQMRDWITVDVPSGYVAYDAHDWCRNELGGMVYKPVSFTSFLIGVILYELFLKEHPSLVGVDYKKCRWIYDYHVNPTRFWFKTASDAMYFRLAGF